MQIHDDPWKYCEQVLLWDFTSPQKEAWCGILVQYWICTVLQGDSTSLKVWSHHFSETWNLQTEKTEETGHTTHQSVQQWLSVVISFRSHFFWTPKDCKGHVICMLPASRLRLNRLAVGDDVEYWSSSSKCFGESTPCRHLWQVTLPETNSK